MEGVKLSTDMKVDNFLSDNHEADFWRSISQSEPLTLEENMELLREYKKYEVECPLKKEIRDRLIDGNIRLIASVVKPFVYRSRSYKFLDLLNQGVIGFIEGLNRFDLSYGTQLSTYVVPWIRHSIGRALKANDKEIRRPEQFEDSMNKYRAIVDKAIKEGTPIPDDEKLAKMLNVSIETVKLMREDYKMDAVSMDAKVKDDEDTSFGEFLGSTDGGYNDVLSRIVDKEIYAYLKTTLSPFEYYIIFYHILCPEKVLQDFSDELGLTRERIRQVEKNVLIKIKKVFANEQVLRKKMTALRNDYDVDNINIYPVSPGAIPFFFFIKENLTNEEQQLYALLVYRLENYKKDYYMDKLGVDVTSYDEIYRSLMYKIKTLKSGVYWEAYNSYKSKFMNEFKGNGIYMRLDGPRPIFYKATVEYWNNVILSEMEALAKNFEFTHTSDGRAIKNGISREISKLLADAGNTISETTKKLIKKYFTFIYESPITFEQAEREVNVILHGYKNTTMLPIKMMYEATLKYKSSFSEEQFDYLMAYYFRKMPKKEFVSKYPNSNMALQHNSLLFKIEKLCLGVARAHNYDFTKEKFVAMREECLAAGLDKAVGILDLFFGVGCEAHSIEEIALLREISYKEAHSMVRAARENCLALRVSSKMGLKKLDLSIYIPYLEDDAYDLNSRGRAMCKAHLIDKKTYKEIAETFGVKSSQVSNTINDTLRQIDFYRFGILRSENRYSDGIMKEILGSHIMYEEEEEIVQNVLKKRDYSAVAKSLKMTYAEIRATMKKFYNLCYSRSIKNVELTDSDIVDEVNSHLRERLLTDGERTVLAYLYGVECDCNTNGEKLSCKIIAGRMNISIEKVYAYKRHGLESIAAKKIGVERPVFAFMKVAKLKELLMDPCVPLTNKEKDILTLYFGLFGSEILDLREIARKFGMNENSVRRSIQRSFLSLFKYEAGEIEGVISYEEHVIPNLRYFPKSDQTILTAVYRDELSYSELAKKFNITRDQAFERVFKLKVYLLDILSGMKKVFDYDYFEEHVMDDDVPFYGNKELAYRIWWMDYEEKKSIPNIIDELDSNFKYGTIWNDMDTLMCAVLKRKFGITKCKEFSYEEIRDYYLTHQSEMSALHKVYYFRYFEHNKEKEKRHEFRSRSDVSMVITLDMIKDRDMGYRPLDDMTREEVIEFIRKYKTTMSRGCLAALYCKFRIQGKDFMSGSDQNKVIRALSYLESESKVLKFNPKQ